MKQFLLFTLISVFSLGLSAQTVYVNGGAADGGDGTSWATAYNNLNDAINVASSGSTLWIAAGTYTTPDTASFFIDKELSLLGGFAGTETSADAADPATNVTTLSGDVAGDDALGVYDSTAAAADNNRILFIRDTAATSKFVVRLDGLTFANGKVADNYPFTGSRFPFSGGAILSSARINGSRLTFTGNRADHGSTVALFGGNANGSRFDELTVADNFSALFSQVYFQQVDDVMITNSDFDGKNAEVSSGMIGTLAASNITIEDSEFKDFTVVGDRGGVVAAYSSDNITLRGSTVDNVVAVRGAALYGEQVADLNPDNVDENDLLLDNCIVRNSAGTLRGAAIATTRMSAKITGCTFENLNVDQFGLVVYQFTSDARDYTQVINTSTFSSDINGINGVGGAVSGVLARGTGDFIGKIDGLELDGLDAPGSQGGLFYMDSKGFYTFNDCTFKNHEAGAATIMIRGLVGAEYNNCTFEENGGISGPYIGAGAAFLFDNDSPGASFDNCTFTNNTTGSSNFSAGGSAIYISSSLTPVPVSITNSTFTGNATVDETSGGAIRLIGGMDFTMDNVEFSANSAAGQGGAIDITVFNEGTDTLADGTLNLNWQMFSGAITSSKFIDNLAGTQGGAIATNRASFDLSNSLFANNTLGSAGVSGGAIILNGAGPFIDDNGEIGFLDTLELTSVMVNNTFYGNAKGLAETAVGDNVALFQPGATGGEAGVLSMDVTLLNNVFFVATGDASLEVEPGTDEPDVGLVPVGDLTVTSLGGNFFNGELDSEDFTLLPTDIVDANITDGMELFLDPEDDLGNGRLFDPAILGDNGADNPLINNGVVDPLVPEFDIQDSPRGDRPDIGAIEADQGLTGTDQPIVNSGLQIDIFPNPTADVVNIRNTDATISSFQVFVSDQTGRVLSGSTFNGDVNTLDLRNLPGGVYNLRLLINGSAYSQQVVKQ